MEWKLCLVVKDWEDNALGMKKVKEKNIIKWLLYPWWIKKYYILGYIIINFKL